MISGRPSINSSRIRRWQTVLFWPFLFTIILGDAFGSVPNENDLPAVRYEDEANFSIERLRSAPDKSGSTDSMRLRLISQGPGALHWDRGGFDDSSIYLIGSVTSGEWSLSSLNGSVKMKEIAVKATGPGAVASARSYAVVIPVSLGGVPFSFLAVGPLGDPVENIYVLERRRERPVAVASAKSSGAPARGRVKYSARVFTDARGLKISQAMGAQSANGTVSGYTLGAGASFSIRREFRVVAGYGSSNFSLKQGQAGGQPAGSLGLADWRVGAASGLVSGGFRSVDQLWFDGSATQAVVRRLSYLGAFVSLEKHLPLFKAGPSYFVLTPRIEASYFFALGKASGVAGESGRGWDSWLGLDVSYPAGRYAGGDLVVGLGLAAHFGRFSYADPSRPSASSKSSPFTYAASGFLGFSKL